MKYYIAYGSNLSLGMMAERCPHAVISGHGMLKNMRLLCKGETNRFYLTVEPASGHEVPVGIWQIEEEDEKQLDKYEDYPALYDKKSIEIDVFPYLPDMQPVKVNALIYTMKEGYTRGLPKQSYIDICKEGYRRFGFDLKYLDDALKESK